MASIHQGGVPTETGLEMPPMEDTDLETLLQQDPSAAEEALQAFSDQEAIAPFSQEPATPPDPASEDFRSVEEVQAGRREAEGQRQQRQNRGSILPGQQGRLQSGSVARLPNGTLRRISPSGTPQRTGRSLSGAMLESVLDIPGAVTPETRAALEEATQQAQIARAAATAAQTQGMEDQADLLDDIADQHLTDAIELQEASKQAKEETDQAIGRLQDITNAIGEARIDPNRLFNTGPASNRFAAAIAIAAGTMAQSMNPGTQNAALQVVTSAVDRDLRAQVADIQRLGQQAAGQRSVLAALRQSYQDDLAAMAGYRAMRLAQAATQMRSMATRNAGTQTATNFLAAEAELRRQALAAQAEAERNIFRRRLSIKQAMSVGQGERFARRQLGLPVRARGGRGRSATRPQALGPEVAEVLGGRRTVDEATARQYMNLLNQQTGTTNYSIGELEEGQWTVFDLNESSEVPLEQIESLQEVAGLELPGININITSTQRQQLESIYGEHAYEIYAALGDLEGLKEALRTFEDVDGREGWAIFSEENAESEAAASTLATQLAQAQGLGALAGPDLDLIERQVENPLSIFNPNATARLRSTIRTIENSVFAKLRSAGVDTSNARVSNLGLVARLKSGRATGRNE